MLVCNVYMLCTHRRACLPVEIYNFIKTHLIGLKKNYGELSPRRTVPRRKILEPEIYNFIETHLIKH